MDAVHPYPIMVIGSVLAPIVWVSRRRGVPLSGQVEIAFFIGIAALWMGATVDLFSTAQAPFRFLERQDEKPAFAIAPPGGRKLPKAQPSEPLSSPSNPLLGLDGSTAVYDISAHTVYLPDGTALEAHSGLGSRLDDPHYAHERMRGPTPPHLYELALREQLFHGVQALRLNPIGGGTTYGRAGLLAHTYMLGPKGDSNGCVVFKNYSTFLQAFQNGEVKRLFVVDHLDWNEYPRSIAAR